ncbi:MAG: hypothetical protein PHE73_08450 [Sulfurovaceae bacterium]|nr:hypothetical protein [Sulfurovaceae bacterium]
MIKKQIILFVCVITVALSNNQAEVTINSSLQLIALEKEMNIMYNNALTLAINKQKLRDEQEIFLLARKNCLNNTMCLKTAVENRIAQLKIYN